MGYFYLILAIVAEVVGTTALKASEEFTKLIPSIIVVVGYLLAFYLLALVLRYIPLGIAYAIWAGVGIVLITIIAQIFFNQKLDIPSILGIGFIVVGVVIINMFSSTNSL